MTSNTAAVSTVLKNDKKLSYWFNVKGFPWIILFSSLEWSLHHSAPFGCFFVLVAQAHIAYAIKMAIISYSKCLTKQSITDWEMLIKSCYIFCFLRRMQSNQVNLQYHCYHDLKNMHSMLFLKRPACWRKYPYPHHGRDLPHAPPPPNHSSSVLSLRIFQESSSPHTYPPPKLIQKKNPYPHSRRNVPHAPLPYPFGFSRIAPVPKHTPSCCPDSCWQNQSSNAWHTFYRVSWIWLSREKTLVHEGKLCSGLTRILLVSWNY